MRRVATAAVNGLMSRALRRAFRQVCWVGEQPTLPSGVPLILYANHHNFFDGYLMWLLAVRHLQRPSVTWMEDLDTFPFFRASGALPFPVSDVRRRVATVRRTQQLFQRRPDALLVYFAEGRLHPAEEGVLPLETAALKQLASLLPTAQWWPVAIHITWAGGASPTALLTGGSVHPQPDGGETARLEVLLDRLRRHPAECTLPLLRGRRGPQEQWNFRWAGPLFERLFRPGRAGTSF